MQKHGKGWDRSEDYVCGVKFDIKGKSFPHYLCMLGQCKEHTKNEYQAPIFE